VVRQHAAENVDSGFSFAPIVEMSTHTFGANIEFRPDQLDLTKIGRLVKRNCCPPVSLKMQQGFELIEERYPAISEVVR
jgi:hypothetical protein